MKSTKVLATLTLTAMLFVIIPIAAVFAADTPVAPTPAPTPTPAPVTAPAAPAPVASVQGQSFPYVGQIIGDGVMVRSGPGTNYYPCGKLNRADKVRVVGSQFSWSQIVPPPGSFSWIAKQYVTVDAANAASGTITGDGVRVYAGAEGLKAIHSTTTQTRLSTGDKVQLLGQEEGDYYKIAPPANAFLWVSTEFTEVFTAPVTTMPPAAPSATPAATPAAATVQPAKADPNAPAAAAAAAKPADVSLQAQMLAKYKALEEQVKAERKKPVDQQNYVEIKSQLKEIADNNDAGKAARYAKFTMQQVERAEMGLSAIQEVQQQDVQLQGSLKRIDNARTEKLAEVPDLGKFVIIGILQRSSVFGSGPGVKHYRITDVAGKTVCYAVATSQAADMDLASFLGKKVGLIGTIERHQATGGSLVKFTNLAVVN